MSLALTPCLWPIAQLLPHRTPMVLLDEVIEYSDSLMVAAARIGQDHLFAAADGVPAYVGIELMAQTCGAFAGARSLGQGEPVRIGLLLGTRRYQCTTDMFAFGDRLVIWATLIFQDQEMGVFDCRIDRREETIATAQLTVYQPHGGGVSA